MAVGAHDAGEFRGATEPRSLEKRARIPGWMRNGQARQRDRLIDRRERWITIGEIITDAFTLPW